MNDEITFLNSDPETIYDQMQDAYYENGGDVLWPGDEKQIFLYALAYILAVERARVNGAGRAMLLRYKTGSELDAAGEEKGIARIKEKSATLQAQATFAPGNYTIEAGAQFLAGEKLYFSATKTVRVTQGSVLIDLLASEAGSQGNAVTAGTVLSPVDSIPGLNRIMAVAPSYGGADMEGDDEYRERIRTGSGYLTAGTKASYEKIAKEVDVRIIDANASSPEPGEVLIVLLLSDEGKKENEKILDAVRKRLVDDDVRFISNGQTVQEAQEVPYDIVLRYKAEEGTENSTLEALEAAVDGYRAWQDGAIGRAIDAYQLLVRTIDLAQRVELYTKPDYTPLGADEVGKGTITLEAMA